MELPSYRLPSLRSVAARVGESGWSFVQQAGTLIVAVAVVVWAAAYFPHDPQVEQELRGRYAGQPASHCTAAGRIAAAPADVSPDEQSGRRTAADWQAEKALEQRIDNEVAAAYMERSYLGQAGKRIAPLVEPLGWDWRIGCAVLASFPAREVVISSLGVIYRVGQQDGHAESLRKPCGPRPGRAPSGRCSRPRGAVHPGILRLCAQCAATLAVIRRETNSWRWPAFTLAYMTALAYLGGLVTYQVGMLFTN